SLSSLLSLSGAPPHPPSFPTRRSSDLPQAINSYPLLQHAGEGRLSAVEDILAQAQALGRPVVRTPAFMDGGDHPARIRDSDGSRSEEHTSELQSRENLVCRLLLEKKNH